MFMSGEQKSFLKWYQRYIRIFIVQLLVSLLISSLMCLKFTIPSLRQLKVT